MLGISRKKLGNIKRQVAEGHLDPPPPDKHPVAVQLRGHPQYDHADSWIAYVYTYVAEHRADVIIPDDAGKEHGEGSARTDDVIPEVFDGCMDLPLGDSTDGLPKKFLPPGQLAELFEYCSRSLCTAPPRS